jgi:tetratricopeptide (TPR) repeat protein
MFDDLTRAIILHPENPLYWLARGQQNYHFKQFPQAFSDFTEVLKVNADSLDALRGHLLSAVELKKFAEAKADAEKLAKLGQPVDAETMKRIDAAAPE